MSAPINYEYYMKKINEKKKLQKVSDVPSCSNCNNLMELDEEENEYICADCGLIKPALSSNDGVFATFEQDIQATIYKKMNHFIEWLDLLQSKNGFISKDVYDQIDSYLKKRKITDMEKINYTFVKQILKQLKLSKYYDYVPLIIMHFQGYNSIVIDVNTNNLLKQKFHEIQRPFFQVRPSSRLNFLSYPYVIHKLCELIGRHDLVKNFPLLKNRKILIEQEQIWKNMMKVLGWEFIPTL